MPLPSVGDRVEFMSDRQVEKGPSAGAVVAVDGRRVKVRHGGGEEWLDWDALEGHRGLYGTWIMKSEATRRRSAPILLVTEDLLKATKLVTKFIPGYTKKDGTFVPPHQKRVLVSDDHDHEAVASGGGSHYQKQAHKKLSKEVSGFSRLPAKEKARLVLAQATELQQAASAAAAVSQWKKHAFAGQNPKPAMWAAFYKLPGDVRYALVAEAEKKSGKHQEDFLVPPHAGQPPAAKAPPPKTEPASPEPSGKTATVTLDGGGTAEVLAADGKPVTYYHGGASVPTDKLNALTYFTTSKSAAEQYAADFGAGGSVHEAVLAIKNPANEEQVKAAGKKVGLTAEDFGMADEESVAGFEYLSPHLHEKAPLVVAELKKQGFDGAAFDTDFDLGGKPIASVVVFDSAQIVPASKVAGAAADSAQPAGEQPMSLPVADALRTGQYGAQYVNSSAVFASPAHPTTEQYEAAVAAGYSMHGVLTAAGGKAYIFRNADEVLTQAGMASLLGEDGPKEGDTKPGAGGGTLVFKDGRWRKQEEASQGKPFYEVLQAQLIEGADDADVDEKGIAKQYLKLNPGKEAEVAETLAAMGFHDAVAELGLPPAPKPKKPQLTGWHDTAAEVEQYIEQGNLAMLEQAVEDLENLGALSVNAKKVHQYAVAGAAYLKGQGVKAEPLPLVTHAGPENMKGQVFQADDGTYLAQLVDGDSGEVVGTKVGFKTYEEAVAAAHDLANGTGAAEADDSARWEAKLAGMASGAHYQKAAIKKLEADPAWQKLPAKDKHAQAHALYKQLQAEATFSAKISQWKKKMLAGKQPSPGEAAAYMELDSDKAKALFAEVSAAIGAPAAVKLHTAALAKAGKAAKEQKQAQPAIVVTTEPPASKPTPPDWNTVPGGNVAPLAPTHAASYQHTSDGHNKFWNAHVDGNKLITHYGKIGSKGSTSAKEYDSPKAAYSAKAKLEAQKKAKGYQFVGLVPLAAGAAPAPAQKPVQEPAKPAKLPAKVAKLQAIRPAQVESWLAAAPGQAGLHSGFFDHLTKTSEKKFLKWNAFSKGDSPWAARARSAAICSLFGQHDKVLLKDGQFVPAKDVTIGMLASPGVVTDVATIKEAAIAEALGGKSAPAAGVSDGPQEGDTKVENGVTYVLKNGRWHKAPGQDKPEPAAPSAPGPSAASVSPHVAAAAGKASVTNMDGWSQTGPQAGSNPGGRFKDTLGQEWYCKFPGNPDVVKNEFLAAKFYQMLGVAVPHLKLVEKGGQLGIASKWVDGLKKGSHQQLAGAKGAHEGFVIDAWLANWDVVGLANDNLLIGPKGEAVRADVGGSLVYRAQGGEKGAAFGNEVAELKSLLDAGTNANSAAVFKGVSKASMLAGGRQLAKLKPSQIAELVDAAGPGDAAAKTALTAKLIARRAHILKTLGLEDPWDKPPVDESKLRVSSKDLPAPIDFHHHPEKNGGPLSSKEWVNEQNSKDSAALVAFAAQGNLKALKNYHYDAVDKETGAPLGKKPITDHPSKHVKEQWAGLVELLSSIAYPPVDSLDMPSLGSSSSFDELAAMAGAFAPTDRVETVPAEHRMGYFMKLGSFDGVAELVKNTKWTWLTPQSGFVKQAKAKYSSLSSAVRGYISSVQASGWINHLWSQGKTKVDAGSFSGGVQSLSSKIYKEATELPENIQLWRWMSDNTAGKGMMAQLLQAKPGQVLQNTDSMCCSYKEGWGSSPHFGNDVLMRIRCPKGSKATCSFASGAYSSEYEITTLPGARFVVVETKKGIPGNSNGVLVDVVMLPPDEGYVAELGKLEQLGKSFAGAPILLIFAR